jgi:aspartate ammonia-lyase
MRALTERTIRELRANEARARELLERSTAAATALSPYLGYDATAEVAKESIATGRSIREVVLARGLLDPAKLDSILSTEAMTHGGIAGTTAQPRAARARAARRTGKSRRTPAAHGVRQVAKVKR